jgi:hypothetical protein
MGMLKGAIDLMGIQKKCRLNTQPKSINQYKKEENSIKPTVKTHQNPQRNPKLQ